MNSVALIAYFFGGACLTNAIPHLVSGLTGRSFPSIFSRPAGVGLSSSVVNFFWGWANIIFAYLLVFRVGAFDLRTTSHVVSAGIGSVIIGFMLAHQFGKLYGAKSFH